MKKILVFFSAIGGAAFGLLFAPKSGKQLRSDLKKNSDPKVIAQILGNTIMEAGKNLAHELQYMKNTPAVKKKISEFQTSFEKEVQNLKKFIKKEASGVKNTATKQANKVVEKVAKKVKN